jgi:hypothetical protein
MMVLCVVVPCVVCQNAPTQSYSFVVAGQPECPAGFTLDYNGYFMSHAYTQSISEHVCVDSAAQSIGTSTSGTMPCKRAPLCSLCVPPVNTFFRVVSYVWFNSILNITENGHLLYFVEFPSVLFNYLAGYEV